MDVSPGQFGNGIIIFLEPQATHEYIRKGMLIFIWNLIQYHLENYRHYRTAHLHRMNRYRWKITGLMDKHPRVDLIKVKWDRNGPQGPIFVKIKRRRKKKICISVQVRKFKFNLESIILFEESGRFFGEFRLQRVFYKIGRGRERKTVGLN